MFCDVFSLCSVRVSGRVLAGFKFVFYDVFSLWDVRFVVCVMCGVY